MDTLVHRAKKHDKAAFGELMRIYSVSMYKIAKAILKNDEDAADAIQETALTCWEKIDMLKKDGYFKTWMTRILINHCNALYQKRRKIISGEIMPETGFFETNYSTIEWKDFCDAWMKNTASSLSCIMWKDLKSGKLQKSCRLTKIR